MADDSKPETTDDATPEAKPDDASEAEAATPDAKSETKAEAEAEAGAEAKPEAEAEAEAEAKPEAETKPEADEERDAPAKSAAKPEAEPEVPAKAEAAEPASNKRWVIPVVLGTVAVAAIVAFVMTGNRDPDKDPALGPEPGSEAPEMVQCLALAKAGKYEFQKGLDIDSNSLDEFAQKLGISNKELIEASQNPEVDQAIVDACRSQFGTASAAALSVVSSSGVPVEGAKVTVKGGYGFAKGCSTDASGSCTITIPTMLEGDSPLILAALADGKRGGLETTVGELESKPIELKLSTTLAKCTIEVVEHPGGSKLLDIERIDVALDSADAPIEAEEGAGSEKGSWSFECSGRAELGAGKYRVTRAGVPKEFAFESVELTATLSWAGESDSGGSGGAGSGGSGGGSKAPSGPADCSEHAKTKKIIQSAIKNFQAEDPNRTCDSATVTVSGRRITKAKPSWLEGAKLGSGALEACTGTVRCP